VTPATGVAAEARRFGQELPTDRGSVHDDDQTHRSPSSAAIRAGQKVVVAGQGYVGLPVAVRAVEGGYRVVGFDTDPDRVKQLNEGESYVEDVPATTLREVLATKRYLASGEARACAGFDYAVITVPTPLAERAPDLSYIESAAATLARYLRPGATVILESTTYPGTTEELVVPVLEERSGLTAGEDFHVGYSPERIDPGNQRFTFVNTPKVVSGIDAASLCSVQAFYETLVDTVVPVSGTAEAELTKLLENTFRHVNVALVNELAMFASDMGIDIYEAIEAASTKPFGFMRFVPGPGVGGHCLPIDPSYLSWSVQHSLGRSFRFVELANDINDHMPDHVVRRLAAALSNRFRMAVNGSRILVIGLSYKSNTGDVRESPAVAVAERLVEMGADVRAVEPYVQQTRDPRISLVDLTRDEVADADAVVLLTDHDAFDLDLVVAEARYVLDTRFQLSGPNVERL
jgi:UDP-N-acetyl-D-glucosamine dehydrogenase